MKTIEKKIYNKPQMTIVLLSNSFNLMAGSPAVGADVDDRDDIVDVGFGD